MMSLPTDNRPVIAWFVLSFFSLSAFCYLLAHHPLPLSMTTIPALLFFLLSYLRPQAALFVVLTLFPCFSFAPWTGWLVFEEIDLLILVFTSGTLLRAVVSPLPIQASNLRASFRLGWTSWFILLFVTGFALNAVWRGILQAGDFNFRWWTNYQTAENALRTGKALLLAPLFLAALLTIGRQQPELLIKRFIQGMTAGLLIAMLGCIYERVIFTGLANFSTDYRTTAWFWEMHLGGAALDAYLAVTIPFALAGWRYCLKPWQQLLMLLFYLAILYVTLTTFSRAVYLAVPVAALVAYMFQDGKKSEFSASTLRLLLMSLLVVVAGTLAVFPEGGYRASFALTASVLMLWALLHAPGCPNKRHWLLAITISALVLAPQLYLPWPEKLPYFGYALLWLTALFSTAALYRDIHSPLVGNIALYSSLLSLNQLVVISANWSEHHQYTNSMWTVLASFLGLALLNIRRKQPAARLPINVMAVAAVSFIGAWLICAMVSASSYLDERFSTVDRDSLGRIQHWQQALDVQKLVGNVWTGAGYGRFTDATYKFGPEQDRISTFSFVERNDKTRKGTALYMHTGNHLNGYGEVLRISQQMVIPDGIATIELQVKTEKTTHIAVEICEKQLLYHGSCVRNALKVTASDDWQRIKLPISDGNLKALDLRPWPNLMFMISSSEKDNRLQLDNIQLIDATGSNLLDNGSFEDQMQSWFFTSDRNHMPYHLKNLTMHIQFEQGLIGIILTSLLVLFVLSRTLFSRIRQHPLAPLIAGALIGLLLIGLFDSVIDAGRMAMMFYLLLWLGSALAVTKVGTQRTGHH